MTDRQAQRLARWVLWTYSVATLALLGALARLLATHGVAGFYVFQQAGPGSSLPVNFIVCGVSWVMLGALVCLSWWPAFAQRHLVFLVVLTLLSFRYLSELREPHQLPLGDARVYYNAAVNMSRAEPIEQLAAGPYLYPPLLAVVLTPLVRLGADGFIKVFHLLNFPAVTLLAVLLYVALQRFRLSRELAAIVTFAVVGANVAISRTLIYNQVNIFVFDLMLLSLLTFERHVWLSALALGLATHLKVFPAVLVLPLLYVRAWRWCAWFLAINLAIVGWTSFAFGFSYYVAFATQLTNIEHGVALRNAAVDGFLHNTFRLLGDSTAPVWLGAGIRGLLGLIVIAALLRLGGRSIFADAEPVPLVVLNSYVVLPVLMLVVAPLVWEHHFVLWILTMPVLASSLKYRHEWWLFLPAYVFLFLMPVYDIYPLSYLRLVGMILITVLLHVLAAREADDEPVFLGRLNEVCRRLSWNAVTGSRNGARS